MAKFTCDVKTMQKLQKNGIALDDVLVFVEQYGPEVVVLLEEALDKGLSVGFITHLLSLLGLAGAAAILKTKPGNLSKPSITANCPVTSCNISDPWIQAHFCTYVSCPKQPEKKFKGIIHEASDVSTDTKASSVMTDLLIQLLPTLLHTYGPQILDALCDALIKYLQEDKTKVTAMIDEALSK